MLVAVLVAMMVALGTAAPVASVTLPVMLANVVWECAEPARKANGKLAIRNIVPRNMRHNLPSKVRSCFREYRPNLRSRVSVHPAALGAHGSKLLHERGPSRDSWRSGSREARRQVED